MWQNSLESDSRRPRHPMEPSMTKNSSSSRAHMALNARMDGARKMAKKKRPKKNLHRRVPVSVRTETSTDSGDKLNLKHLQVARPTSLHDHRDVHNRRNCTCGTNRASCCTSHDFSMFFWQLHTARNVTAGPSQFSAV